MHLVQMTFTLTFTVVCYHFMIFISKPKTVQYRVYTTAKCVFVTYCLYLKLEAHMQSIYRHYLKEAAICVVVKQDWTL